MQYPLLFSMYKFCRLIYPGALINSAQTTRLMHTDLLVHIQSCTCCTVFTLWKSQMHERGCSTFWLEVGGGDGVPCRPHRLLPLATMLATLQGCFYGAQKHLWPDSSPITFTGFESRTCGPQPQCQGLTLLHYIHKLIITSFIKLIILRLSKNTALN